MPILRETHGKFISLDDEQWIERAFEYGRCVNGMFDINIRLEGGI